MCALLQSPTAPGDDGGPLPPLPADLWPPQCPEVPKNDSSLANHRRPGFDCLGDRSACNTLFEKVRLQWGVEVQILPVPQRAGTLTSCASRLFRRVVFGNFSEVQ